ncbi:cation diffusion facilitator family transporter [Paracoccus sp. Z118]|uniref:cation diffusion facilitator family transporter n=1 Tax=Paracoccus sp. Z118 TaxID=2851017 RepID=UPI001C2C2A91|nr:cation diffusion facilitator family transporter [Paracoccus sp. Z118]MBV0890984.1 cation diffusion facilitator family transporter [Paracoccus sp. Z118]
MGHSHGHRHGDSHAHGADLGERGLLWAVVINLALTVAQIAGGSIAGSVALVADGVHNLSDAMALFLAFGARRLARRSATPQMSFGWGRAEILAAFVNYIALIAVSLWLMVEAVGRLFDPPQVQGGLVMALAGLALVVDLGTAWLTMRLAKESVNIRAAFLHNLADAGVSVAVLIGGALIWAFGWQIADPVLTILISVVILWHIRGDIVPILRMLMLGAPAGVGLEAIRGELTSVPGVLDVHHLHVWQIDERRLSAEMHVVMAEDADLFAVRDAVKARLAERFGIRHSTVEVETPSSGCADDTAQAHPHDHGPAHRH